jgi:hypothetical protein
MRCRVPRGCWGWSKDLIPPANPNHKLLCGSQPCHVRFELLFLCQAYSGYQVSLVSENNQPNQSLWCCCSCVKHILVTRRVLYQEIIKPWDTLPTKAMVTLTSVEPTLPCEIQGCCSCVKRALLTRQVLYQEIISFNRRDEQGCCSCLKHSAVTSRVLYQEIISQVHAVTAIAMLTQCIRCAPRQE